MTKHYIAAFYAPFFFLFILFPLGFLVFNLEFSALALTFADPLFWDSVINSIITALGASFLGLIMALGFGYCHLFLKNSWLYKIANFMNDLPISLPHTVAGLALLLAFGRKTFGFVGPTGFAFTLFAVTLAMFFVSYPLAARNIAASVDKMDTNLVSVARSLGDSPGKAYCRIVIPNLKEGMYSAFLISFSRSLSEFAAVIMFGGNVLGKTQVLASFVFTKVEEGELAIAVSASVFCIFLSLLVLIFSIVGRKYFARNS